MVGFWFGKSSPKWPEFKIFPGFPRWNILIQSDTGNHKPFRISKHLFVSQKLQGVLLGHLLWRWSRCVTWKQTVDPSAFVTGGLADNLIFLLFKYMVYGSRLMWTELSIYIYIYHHRVYSDVSMLMVAPSWLSWPLKILHHFTWSIVSYSHQEGQIHWILFGRSLVTASLDVRETTGWWKLI